MSTVELLAVHEESYKALAKRAEEDYVEGMSDRKWIPLMGDPVFLKRRPAPPVSQEQKKYFSLFLYDLTKEAKAFASTLMSSVLAKLVRLAEKDQLTSYLYSLGLRSSGLLSHDVFHVLREAMKTIHTPGMELPVPAEAGIPGIMLCPHPAYAAIDGAMSLLGTHRFAHLRPDATTAEYIHRMIQPYEPRLRFVEPILRQEELERLLSLLPLVKDCKGVVEKLFA